jgi:hypothetical protein
MPLLTPIAVELTPTAIVRFATATVPLEIMVLFEPDMTQV